VRRAGLEAVIVAKAASPLPDVDVPVWLEPDGAPHPAAGIAAALERAAGRPVLAIACDMPLVAPGLLLHLAQRTEALVVPRAGGRLHPLCARYEGSVQGQFEYAVFAGTALHEVVAALDPAIVQEPELATFGDPEEILFNVNTREDLALAERLLRGP
jgi:molybdopterin-guanine dinucleotide biosynthesis protein A